MNRENFDPKALAKRIHDEIRLNGNITSRDCREFIDANRESGKEVILTLIELVENSSIKTKLYDMYHNRQYRYDPRLEIIAIWVYIGAISPDPKRT